MRCLSIVFVASLIGIIGCLENNYDAPPPSRPMVEVHPKVRIEGIDGTVMVGELLNGTVIVESGQGALILQTDHIQSIDISAESDTVHSPSVNVSGKVKETQFLLRNEHGVFTLLKERLRKITFVDAPKGTTTAPAPGVRTGGATTFSPRVD